MNGVIEYFQNVRDTVTSIFEGMSITFSHFVRKPSTIQYPDRIAQQVQATLPLRYRGILEVDMDICTGCLACERVCPINCIAIGIEKNAETNQRDFTQFDIDICKCMYCGCAWRPAPRAPFVTLRSSRAPATIPPVWCGISLPRQCLSTSRRRVGKRNPEWFRRWISD